MQTPQRMGPALFPVVLALVLQPSSSSAQRLSATDIEQTLDRVGHRLVEWYDRAQSIVSLEKVEITPLQRDFSPDGFPRRLSYELRIAWEPDPTRSGSLPEPRILRQLLSVNGRAPRARDEPGCMDPKPVSPEPLLMLLPGRRAEFEFTSAGRARVRDRESIMLDFKSLESGTPRVDWRDDCVSVDLPGRWRGRVWIDAENYDVLRLDEQLMGMFDFDVPPAQQRRGAARFLTIERATSSIHYRRVEFQDPFESLMLPAQIDTITVFRGEGTRRTRISQRFSDYRRFLADARVLP